MSVHVVDDVENVACIWPSANRWTFVMLPESALAEAGSASARRTAITAVVLTILQPPSVASLSSQAILGQIRTDCKRILSKARSGLARIRGQTGQRLLRTRS